jgi:hypothetical protein
MPEDPELPARKLGQQMWPVASDNPANLGINGFDDVETAFDLLPSPAAHNEE